MKRFNFTLARVTAFRQQAKKLKEIELAFKKRQFDEATSNREIEQRTLNHLLEWEPCLASYNPDLMLAHRASIETQRLRVKSATEDVCERQQEWALAKEASRKAKRAPQRKRKDRID